MSTREEGKESKEGKKIAARFTPPTVEEVSQYAKSKSLTIDAEDFVDYFVSVGWKVGNKPMKDWQAATRRWAKQNKAKATTSEVTCKLPTDEEFYAWRPT